MISPTGAKTFKEVRCGAGCRQWLTICLQTFGFEFRDPYLTLYLTLLQKLSPCVDTIPLSIPNSGIVVFGFILQVIRKADRAADGLSMPDQY